MRSKVDMMYDSLKESLERKEDVKDLRLSSIWFYGVADAVWLDEKNFIAKMIKIKVKIDLFEVRCSSWINCLGHRKSREEIVGLCNIEGLRQFIVDTYRRVKEWTLNDLEDVY